MHCRTKSRAACFRFFFDGLLVACSLREAQERIADMPELFDRVPARSRVADDGGDEWILDDDWDFVSDHFVDDCRWDEWEVPVINNHPLLAAMLRDRHLYTWFDPTEPSGPGYLQRLMGLVVDDQPQNAEA